jgi:plastocyanin
MRIPAIAAAAALGAALLAPAPAGAATRSVAIMNFGFSPSTVTVSLGTTVTWMQDDMGVQHTSTSNQAFWGSARMNAGQSFSTVFRAAGAFGYHCAVHPDMTGVVRVPMSAAGSSAAGWTLRWSTFAPVPASRAFDVQLKKPGATAFIAFRTKVSGRTAFFNPAKAGVYQFRARTRNVSNGSNSGWSPIKSVRIT